jgi:ribosomal protein S27E
MDHLVYVECKLCGFKQVVFNNKEVRDITYFFDRCFNCGGGTLVKTDRDFHGKDWNCYKSQL